MTNFLRRSSLVVSLWLLAPACSHAGDDKGSESKPTPQTVCEQFIKAVIMDKDVDAAMKHMRTPTLWFYSDKRDGITFSRTRVIQKSDELKRELSEVLEKNEAVKGTVRVESSKTLEKFLADRTNFTTEEQKAFDEVLKESDQYFNMRVRSDEMEVAIGVFVAVRDGEAKVVGYLRPQFTKRPKPDGRQATIALREFAYPFQDHKLDEVLKSVDVPFYSNASKPDKGEVIRDRDSLKKLLEPLVDGFKDKTVGLNILKVLSYAEFLETAGDTLSKEDRELLDEVLKKNGFAAEVIVESSGKQLNRWICFVASRDGELKVVGLKDLPRK